ncbi:MAG: hypothetical protein M1812_006611 [Candelaria pacifica]|nr:MAG: hypothetical protein M1812_006611 [Candelaria pacifica]
MPPNARRLLVRPHQVPQGNTCHLPDGQLLHDSTNGKFNALKQRLAAEERQNARLSAELSRVDLKGLLYKAVAKKLDIASSGSLTKLYEDGRALLKMEEENYTEEEEEKEEEEEREEERFPKWFQMDEEEEEHDWVKEVADPILARQMVEALNP